MHTVSIIIPIYNSEKYLDKCIKSVLMQSYSDWEAILIDDGSTDRSYQICKEYAKKDSRLKVIHTENKGRVHARKIGMKNAEGNFITFMDSDDWIEPQAIGRMYTEMMSKAVDCVIMGYIETSSVGEKVVLNNLKQGIYRDEEIRQQILPVMLCYGDFFEFGIHPFLWNKLFKREMIEQYILNIDERIVIGEDVASIFPAMCSVSSISILNEAYYHYCIYDNSTMRTFRSEKEEVDNIKIQYQFLEIIFKNSIYHDCLMVQLNHYVLHHLIVRAFGYINNKKSANTLFPFERIPVGAKIIVYGAGAFGMAVYQFLYSNSNYKICCWCDKEYLKFQKMGCSVHSIDSAMEMEYDYIVVAVMSKRSVESIKQSLIDRGIELTRIKWLDEEVFWSNTKTYLY